MATRNDILIQIRADLRDLNAKLGELQGVSKDAADEVAGTWDGVTGQFAKLGLAIQGAREAFDLLLAPIKSVVNTAADFQTLQTRLTGLYGSIEAGSRAFERFNSVAASTPFSLQQVVEAGAQLKAFGADAEELILSMSDLAAFMGVDIVEASAAFGRAFAGGAGAADILRERGVLQLVKSFSGIEDLTKTTLPEFRAALISAIQDPTANIAGSSERLAETFAGAVSNMEDSLDRLKDAIGAGLIPTLTGLATSVGGLFTAIEENLQTIARVVSVAVAAITGLTVAVVASRLALLNMTNTTLLLSFALGRARDAAIAAGAALGLSPVGIAVGLVAALATGLALLVKPFEDVKKAASDTSTAVDRFAEALDGVALSEFWANADTYAANLSKIADESARLNAEAERMASGMVEAGKAVQDALGGMESSFQPTAEAIQFLGVAIAATTKRAKEAKAEADALAKADTDATVKAAEAREKRLSDIRRGAIDREIKERQDAYARLVQMREAYDLLMGRLELERIAESADVDRQIAERNQATVDAAIASSEASWSEYISNLQSVAGAMAATFDQLGKGIQAVFEGQQGAMRNLLKGSLLIVLDYMKQIIQAANLKALADAILLFNPAQIAKNFAFLAGIEAAFAALRSGVTAFEKGGIVTGPTMALIGENIRKSGPEAVLPLNHLPKMLVAPLTKALAAQGGVGGMSDKLLQGLNDRIDRMDARIASLAPAIGIETGRAVASIARGKV